MSAAPPRRDSMSAASGAVETKIVSVAFVSRVATVALMILGNTFLPTHNAGGVHKFRPRTFPVPDGPAGVPGGILSAFTRWDGAWFLSIADSGYPHGSSPGEGIVGGVGERDGEGLVDCRGTARAWGGEDYHQHHPRSYSPQGRTGGWDTEGRGDVGEHKRPPPWSVDEKPRCRPDTPLAEQAHAFFPMYPWLVRWAAAALRALVLPFGDVLGEANSLVLAAVLVSNLCFVAAAVLLYRLGTVVTGDSFLAYRGALAFCATPASVFFSTAYTESLYAALSFAGLLVLFSEGRRCSMNDQKRIDGGGNNSPWWSRAVNAWVAAAFLSLATLTRSNGIAGAGVLILEKFRWMARDAGLFTDRGISSSGIAAVDAEQSSPSAAAAAAAAAARRSSVVANTPSKKSDAQVGKTVGGFDDGGDDQAAEGRGKYYHKRGNAAAFPWLKMTASLVATALQALLVIAPYILVQFHAYRKFCMWESEAAVAAGEEEGGIGGGEMKAEALRQSIEQLHPWCSWRVPSLYAYVQSAYWGVGALKYYQWKQIPNFLLAAPVLILTARGAFQFFSAQLRSLPVAAAAGGRKTGEVAAEKHHLALDSGGIRSEGSRDRGGESTTSLRLCSDFAVRICPWWLEKLAVAFLGPPRLPGPAASPFERTGAAALIAQWAFLAFFAAVCMNVQVSTRFLAAACPPLHWWTATTLVARSGEEGGNGKNAAGIDRRTEAAAAATAGSEKGIAGELRIGTYLRWYLGVYFVVGAVLHANFLPWT